MKTFPDLLAMLGLMFVIAGCDSGAATTPSRTETSTTSSEQEVAESESVDSFPINARLFVDLEQREAWPSNSVKIWLANPTVSITTLSPGNHPAVIHAWSRNENDFNIAMMRIDQGDKLYAITDEEFRLLDEWQQIPVLTTTQELDAHVGQLVTIRGEVFNSKIPTIIGVDVQSNNPDLRGEYAEATGILQRTEVTKEQIQNANFAHRGAGIFYRLKDRNSDYEASVRRTIQPVDRMRSYEWRDLEGRWRQVSSPDSERLWDCLHNTEEFTPVVYDLPPDILINPVPLTVSIRMVDETGEIVVMQFDDWAHTVTSPNGDFVVPDEKKAILIQLFEKWKMADSKRIASQPLPCKYQVGLAEDEKTLSGIARLFYDDASKWREIYEANKDVISDPNVIRPGMMIVIPNLD